MSVSSRVLTKTCGEKNSDRVLHSVIEKEDQLGSCTNYLRPETICIMPMVLDVSTNALYMCKGNPRGDSRQT